MSDKMKQILENIKELSPHEKAMLAHCLISSLDQANNDDVDDAWAELAEARFSQLESGEVKPITWDKIKLGLKRQA